MPFYSRVSYVNNENSKIPSIGENVSIVTSSKKLTFEKNPIFKISVNGEEILDVVQNYWDFNQKLIIGFSIASTVFIILYIIVMILWKLQKDYEDEYIHYVITKIFQVSLNIFKNRKYESYKFYKKEIKLLSFMVY